MVMWILKSQPQQTGFPDATAWLTILDDELPALNLSLSTTEVTGETFELTLTRGLVTDQSLTVNLLVSNAGQINLPASLTLEPQQASITIHKSVIDNNIPELDEMINITATMSGFMPATASIIT